MPTIEAAIDKGDFVEVCFVCVYVYMCVCIYIYLYIYTYIYKAYIYVYIYLYIYMFMYVSIIDKCYYHHYYDYSMLKFTLICMEHPLMQLKR
jgi:hypothetical protein